MNGAHDLGGFHGLGRVQREENEPVFHSEWEKGVFALLFATLGNGLINVDEFRFGIEQMHPAYYLSSRYYEHWLFTIEKGLVEKGIISKEELDARARRYREDPQAQLPERKDPKLADRMAALIKRGAPCTRPSVVSPRFAVGQPVRAKNINPTGHTRLARYVRGKRGVIHKVHGTFVTPDTNALGKGENPQPVYSVAFPAWELWGWDSAEPNETIYVDLWESYLEPA